MKWTFGLAALLLPSLTLADYYSSVDDDTCWDGKTSETALAWWSIMIAGVSTPVSLSLPTATSVITVLHMQRAQRRHGRLRRVGISPGKTKN